MSKRLYYGGEGALLKEVVIPDGLDEEHIYTHYKPHKDEPMGFRVEENEQVVGMGESASRYSIVENLTKDKASASNAIKALQQTKLQKERDIEKKRIDDARMLEEMKADYDVFKKQADLEIAFQNAKIAELDKAVDQIAKISKEVSKPDAQ